MGNFLPMFCHLGVSFQTFELFIVLYIKSPFCQNLEGRDLWHTLQKSQFLHDFGTKSGGVFAEVQMITCIILNHIQF